MENFPWWAVLVIGMSFGVFVGCIIGFAAMQRLNEYEKRANKK